MMRVCALIVHGKGSPRPRDEGDGRDEQKAEKAERPRNQRRRCRLG